MKNCILLFNFKILECIICKYEKDRFKTEIKAIVWIKAIIKKKSENILPRA